MQICKQDVVWLPLEDVARDDGAGSSAGVELPDGEVGRTGGELSGGGEDGEDGGEVDGTFAGVEALVATMAEQLRSMS